MDYDGPISDYTSNQLSLVARKEWRIVSLEAAAGYQKREFDDAGQEDIEVVPYRFTLEGRSSSQKSRFSLSAEQNFNFLDRSVQEGYYEAMILAHPERWCDSLPSYTAQLTKDICINIIKTILHRGNR